MKNKYPILKYILGGIAACSVYILASMCFQKWHVFNLDNQPQSAIIASGVFVGIISSLSVYIYSKGKALNHPKK